MSTRIRKYPVCRRGCYCYRGVDSECRETAPRELTYTGFAGNVVSMEMWKMDPEQFSDIQIRQKRLLAFLGDDILILLSGYNCFRNSHNEYPFRQENPLFGVPSPSP